MRPMDDQGWISEAASILGVGLKYHTTGQACGPCPRCGGRDRFTVFIEGNSFCRQCKLKKWWNKPDNVKERIAEEIVRKAEEQSRLRASMADCKDWVGYHDDLLADKERLSLWEAEGLTVADIRHWGLGWCASCPLAPGRPSVTIPVFYGQRLYDIRHRLIDGVPGDKYRSHMAGLVPFPFNLGGMTGNGPHILVVEGEKKAIHCHRAGIKTVVGLPGVSIYQEFVAEVSRMVVPGEQDITVLTDPGATESAEEIARAIQPLGVPVFIADAFAKPDAILLEHGRGALRLILSQARRYGPGRPRLARWT